jgi:hypothetical protein
MTGDEKENRIPRLAGTVSVHALLLCAWGNGSRRLVMHRSFPLASVSLGWSWLSIAHDGLSYKF